MLEASSRGRGVLRARATQESLRPVRFFPINPMDHAEVTELAKKLEVDYVVVGPEDPLIGGLADALRGEGISVVGPGREGATLEGSKAFSKSMMVEAGVPTARGGEFKHPDTAKAFAAEFFAAGNGVAVKASGAALGKGVVVCTELEQALAAIDDMMVHKVHGTAGETVVVEQMLVGQEFSLLTLVSGQSYQSLPVSQDYKRAFDGDRGPNTGGMGTYSPVGWLDQSVVEETERTVVEPLLQLMAGKGIDFRGVLFSGLMVEDGVPYCLEYNVRFGDPETQTVMRRLGAGFADALYCVAKGEQVPQIGVSPLSATTVVLASGGYPGSYEKGKVIEIPDDLDDEVVVFHAGSQGVGWAGRHQWREGVRCLCNGQFCCRSQGCRLCSLRSHTV